MIFVFFHKCVYLTQCQTYNQSLEEGSQRLTMNTLLVTIDNMCLFNSLAI